LSIRTNRLSAKTKEGCDGDVAGAPATIRKQTSVRSSSGDAQVNTGRNGAIWERPPTRFER
jgi:hypothetical protein